MVAAQHLHRRHVDDREPARLQQPVHLGNRRLFVRIGERIQNIEGSDDIKGGRRKGHGGDGRAREPRAAGFAADSQPDFGQIEAEGAAESVEEFEVGAGAASAIEQTRRRRDPAAACRSSGVTKARKPRNQK